MNYNYENIIVLTILVIAGIFFIIGIQNRKRQISFLINELGLNKPNKVDGETKLSKFKIGPWFHKIILEGDRGEIYTTIYESSWNTADYMNTKISFLFEKRDNNIPNIYIYNSNGLGGSISNVLLTPLIFPEADEFNKYFSVIAQDNDKNKALINSIIPTIKNEHNIRCVETKDNAVLIVYNKRFSTFGNPGIKENFIQAEKIASQILVYNL